MAYPSLTHTRMIQAGFWCLVWVLNCLLFFPVYVMNRGITTFWPSSTLEAGVHLGPWLMVFVRNNLDMFRISADWLLMVTGMILIAPFRRPGRIVAWICAGAYTVLLVYQVYFAVMTHLYGQHPSITNDLVLAREVLPIYLGQITHGSGWRYPLMGIGVVLALMAVGSLVLLLGRWAAEVSRHRMHWVVLGGCWLLAGGILLKNRSDTHRYVYQSVQWIGRQAAVSLQDNHQELFTELKEKKVYGEYMQLTLRRKPNVYLLFTESYGRCMAVKPWGRDRYPQDMARLADTLRAGGWHSASVYSLAPVLGGRSWLSFTTVMSGVSLYDQLQFNTLTGQYPDYPHMIRYFASQGYQTYRLKTFAKQEGSTDAAYALQERFYGFDRWIKHHEIPYRGFKYDFNGGIPDQYALDWFQETVADTTVPRFLFFISMASHWPWFPPPVLGDGWEHLDTVQADPYRIPVPDTLLSEYDQYMLRLEEKIGPRYYRTIIYDLEVFTRFILEHGRPDDIFLIIGDHQPPMVTAYGIDGLESPIHVISRDPALVSGFGEAGFRPGMEADTTLPAPMTHAGVYSLLMRQMLKQYGTDPSRLPAYLPEGL